MFREALSPALGDRYYSRTGAVEHRTEALGVLLFEKHLERIRGREPRLAALIFGKMTEINKHPPVECSRTQLGAAVIQQRRLGDNGPHYIRNT